MANPNNIRQAMNRNDPRQRGLLGAAWNLAYFAHFAQGGAEAIAMGGGVGPFGLVYDQAPYPQPWFGQDGGLFPVFHVLRGLARLKGRRLRRVNISAPREIQAIAASGEGGDEICGSPISWARPGALAFTLDRRRAESLFSTLIVSWRRRRALMRWIDWRSP
jgi:hypothetical protein